MFSRTEPGKLGMKGCGLQTHRLAQKRRRICLGNRYAKGGLLRFGLVHCAPVALAADAMLRIALYGEADVFRHLPENVIILFAVPSIYEMPFSLYIFCFAPGTSSVKGKQLRCRIRPLTDTGYPGACIWTRRVYTLLFLQKRIFTSLVRRIIYHVSKSESS